MPKASFFQGSRSLQLCFIVKYYFKLQHDICNLPFLIFYSDIGFILRIKGKKASQFSKNTQSYINSKISLVLQFRLFFGLTTFILKFLHSTRSPLPSKTDPPLRTHRYITSFPVHLFPSVLFYVLVFLANLTSLFFFNKISRPNAQHLTGLSRQVNNHGRIANPLPQESAQCITYIHYRPIIWPTPICTWELLTFLEIFV